MHFGLGSATKIDSVVVKWPSGYESTYFELEIDRIVTLYEPENTNNNHDGIVIMVGFVLLLGYILHRKG